MKLNDKEMSLIRHLRAMPTCKITVVKFAGEIKHIKAEVDLGVEAIGNAQHSVSPKTVNTQEVR